MTDLFLEPKVLDYQEDRYELILMTLRWARQLKSQGAPQPMQELIEKALRDIVDKKVTKEQILANKPVQEAPKEEVPLEVAVLAEEERAAKLARETADEDDDDKKKTKAKKKK